jgi:hypothetical protein
MILRSGASLDAERLRPGPARTWGCLLLDFVTALPRIKVYLTPERACITIQAYIAYKRSTPYSEFSICLKIPSYLPQMA